MSIADQLANGIRYFDFRCGVFVGKLRLYHDRFPLGFNLCDVLAEMYAWLEKAKTEALILQIKMEGGDGDEFAFEELLRAEITSGAKYWVLDGRIPTLRSIRGKIQLLRRFATRSSQDILGIDARPWANNSPQFTIQLDHLRQARLIIQDQYDYTDTVTALSGLIRQKSTAVEALLRAAQDTEEGVGDSKTWYLNWCNASAGSISFLGARATPFEVAIGNDRVPGMNSLLYQMIFHHPVKVRLGTVLLDFVGVANADLVSAIVRTNKFTSQTRSKYEAK